MNLRTILVLGRVSNLPTVWTNALAGASLATAATIDFGSVAFAAIALTAFYIGGMWLNDAFDAEIDRRERARRPIPEGSIATSTVFVVGALLLIAGVVAGFAMGAVPGMAGLLLALAILLYDWLHKRTRLSPVIMGSARCLSVIFAAAIAGGIGHAAIWGGAGLLLYVAGLTYAARQEAYDRIGRAWPLGVLAAPLLLLLWLSWGTVWPLVLWLALLGVVGIALRLLFRRRPGDVKRAVVTLIAGICLYDAVLVALAGSVPLSLLAAGGFVATLALQKVVPGT